MVEPAGLARAGIGARGSAPTPLFRVTASSTVPSAGVFTHPSQSMARRFSMVDTTADIMDTPITSANSTDPMAMALNRTVDFMLVGFPAADSMVEVAAFTAVAAVEVTIKMASAGLTEQIELSNLWIAAQAIQSSEFIPGPAGISNAVRLSFLMVI
jgi:hypothetical protein